MIKNMKLLTWGILMFLITLIPSACSDNDKTTFFTGNDILSFAVSGDVKGETVIDVENREILCISPAVADLSQLKVDFTLSEGAFASVMEDEVVSGQTVLNFKSPVRFKITAENGDRSYWDVTVSNNDYTAKWGLGLILTEGKSKECSREDGFYLEQHNSGEYSDINCGPAVAAMAGRWAEPRYNASVKDVRDMMIQMGVTGLWSLDNIFSYFMVGGIRNCAKKSLVGSFTDPEEVFYNNFVSLVKGVIDEGKIAIMLINTSYITYDATQEVEYRVNRYYSNEFNHFILVKGYRVVDGVTYLEVCDPWSNNYMYEDGSYMGMNRYYLASDIAKSMQKMWETEILTVQPN